jgi:lysine-N-methylase
MARIEEQGWSKEAGFEGQALFARDGRWPRRGQWHLNHRDGACIFLGEGGRCRIHERFGSAAKPLACRLYPFLLVPSGDHWRIGLRFSCPSAANDQGRPINQHLAELREYASILEQQNPRVRSFVAPPLKARQNVSWDDIDTLIKGLAIIVSEQSDRLERRLRKCLALANLCRQAKFDKITGKRLEEFLGIVIGAVDGETPAELESLPPPSWVGRVLFRQFLALFSRKDTGVHTGIAVRGPIARLWAAACFARGLGPVPRVHGLFPETTFEQMERPAGAIPDEAEAVLERYYLTKIQSMQFAGVTNFRLNFWDGLESLILTFPAILWLSRAFVDLPRTEAIVQALRIVDDSFGYHRLLGTFHQKLSLKILSFTGEIPRIVAWYSR